MNRTHGLTWLVRASTRAAPLIGAALGGFAGSVLGAMFGLAGGAIGGVAGYMVQQIADKMGNAEPGAGELPPKIFGGILTDLSDFVGRKNELTDMSDFLLHNESGVFLLHGFGGCGKSALLKMFTTKSRLLDARYRGNRGHAVFQWSFSQDANLERFFHEFRAHIDPLLPAGYRSNNTSAAGSYLNLPDSLQRSSRKIVLILDGIEAVTVEDEAKDSRDGSLAIPALRVLLQRTAEGGCRSLKVLCTSRVIPPELRRPTADTFVSVDLSRLPLDDGVALLRKKGVRGNRKLIENTVIELRHHAYSIALMGDLLTRVFRGDVRQVGQVLNTHTEIETPIHRILKWYQSQLDPRELAYLQTLSLFKTIITEREIAALLPYVLKGKFTTPITNFASEVRIISASLGGYGLVFSESLSSSYATVGLHPIVREYFYSQISDPANFHKEALRIVESTLPEQADVSNAQQLILLQELVFQALGAGEVALAWKIYSERIGGYPKLGYEMADHPSGTKLVDMFLKHAESVLEHLPSDAIYDLYVDAALYLKNEGRLDDAIVTLRRLEQLEPRLYGTDDRPVSALLVLAGIELLRGNLLDSEASIRRARRRFDRLGTELSPGTVVRLEKEFLTRHAVLKAARGTNGLGDFERASEMSFESGTIPHDYGPIRHIWALTLHGNYASAEGIAIESLAYLTNIGANMLVQRVSSMAALNASWAGDFDSADRWSRSISSWALKADIHVAVLDWLKRGVYAMRNGNSAEAEQILAEGSAFAGDSGFLLEWLDMTVIRAYLALATGQRELALVHAVAVIDGSHEDYLVPLRGGRDPAVEYVWPLASALAIRDLCGGISNPSASTDEVFRRTIAAARASKNHLFHAIDNLRKASASHGSPD